MASVLIERDMYAGRLHLTHNPEARGSQPRYVVKDGEAITKPQGVTTILGQTLSKDLMAWAVDCCVQYLKDKLPVITQADLDEGAKAYTVKRDAGASTGTEAHALVENHLKKIPQDSTTASKEAQKAFKAFVEWEQGAKPTIINVEEVIYSDKFKYAGTYDALMEIDGKVYLTDLKTTNASRKAPNGIYAEYFIQLGAYAAAHEEQRLYEEANGGTKLRPIEGLAVISAKKNGKLDFATNEDLGLSLETCMQMFLKVVNLNTFLKSTTALLGGKG